MLRERSRAPVTSFRFSILRAAGPKDLSVAELNCPGALLRGSFLSATHALQIGQGRVRSGLVLTQITQIGQMAQKGDVVVSCLYSPRDLD